jgi:hypothetical protein
MDEAAWLSSTDPDAMLWFLAQSQPELPPAHDRRLILFACACVRRISHLLLDKRSRAALEVAERFADGAATEAEADTARRRASGVLLPFENQARPAEHIHAAIAATAAVPFLQPLGLKYDPRKVSRHAATALSLEQGRQRYIPSEDREGETVLPAAALAREQAVHAELLRDVIGNPFRPVPTIEPAWLSWNDGTIPRLALSIDNERAFDRMGILADALEEAGCTERTILEHCRGAHQHVRGCWVVDLLLSKDR